jgi:hypothetical protein
MGLSGSKSLAKHYDLKSEEVRSGTHGWTLEVATATHKSRDSTEYTCFILSRGTMKPEAFEILFQNLQVNIDNR